jgi:hypothetical protein
MKIYLNGEELEVPEDTTISELIKSLNIQVREVGLRWRSTRKWCQNLSTKATNYRKGTEWKLCIWWVVADHM